MPTAGSTPACHPNFLRPILGFFDTIRADVNRTLAKSAPVLRGGAPTLVASDWRFDSSPEPHSFGAQPSWEEAEMRAIWCWLTHRPYWFQLASDQDMMLTTLTCGVCGRQWRV